MTVFIYTYNINFNAFTNGQMHLYLHSNLPATTIYIYPSDISSKNTTLSFSKRYLIVINALQQ